jgi:hypothetical protein
MIDYKKKKLFTRVKRNFYGNMKKGFTTKVLRYIRHLHREGKGLGGEITPQNVLNLNKKNRKILKNHNFGP